MLSAKLINDLLLHESKHALALPNKSGHLVWNFMDRMCAKGASAQVKFLDIELLEINKNFFNLVNKGPDSYTNKN